MKGHKFDSGQAFFSNVKFDHEEFYEYSLAYALTWNRTLASCMKNGHMNIKKAGIIFYKISYFDFYSDSDDVTKNKMSGQVCSLNSLTNFEE